LTGPKRGLGAVLVNDDNRHRTVDLSFGAGYPDLNQPVRRWYGARGFAQPS
jgi:hypothetical protein